MRVAPADNNPFRTVRMRHDPRLRILKPDRKLWPPSTRQDALLADKRVSTIGLDKREYSVHSMRRTKASLIHKATANLWAAQILLGHSNDENAAKRQGVDIADALQLLKRTDI